MKLEVGKRVLVNSRGELVSGRVQEFSPSGNYVRIGADWFRTSLTEVLEELPQPEVAAPLPPMAPVLVEDPQKETKDAKVPEGDADGSAPVEPETPSAPAKLETSGTLGGD